MWKSAVLISKKTECIINQYAYIVFKNTSFKFGWNKNTQSHGIGNVFIEVIETIFALNSCLQTLLLLLILYNLIGTAAHFRSSYFKFNLLSVGEIFTLPCLQLD